MIFTPELFANISPRYPNNPTQVKKPSARKSLYVFTNILEVKKKTAIRQVRYAKSKIRKIKAGTAPW